MPAITLIRATPTDPDKRSGLSAKIWEIVMSVTENGITAIYTGKFGHPDSKKQNIFKSDAIEEMKRRIHDLSRIAVSATSSHYSLTSE